MAIVIEWLKSGCSDSIEELVCVTTKCISSFEKNIERT